MRVLADIYDRILAWTAIIVAILLIIAMLLVTAEVISRSFFNSPIGWVLEATETILLYAPFLGLAWLVRRSQGHVRIDVVVNAFDGRTQEMINACVAVIAAIVCFIAGTLAMSTTWDHIGRAVNTGGIYPIPKYTVLFVIALGLLMTGIEFARKALNHYRIWKG